MSGTSNKEATLQPGMIPGKVSGTWGAYHLWALPHDGSTGQAAHLRQLDSGKAGCGRAYLHRAALGSTIFNLQIQLHFSGFGLDGCGNAKLKACKIWWHVGRGLISCGVALVNNPCWLVGCEGFCYTVQLRNQ